MLLREGTSKGNEPTVQVLEIAGNERRSEDDLLPYLSPFAKFFRELPKNRKNLILKRALIPLNDIECLTRTVIDIPANVENLYRIKGAYSKNFCITFSVLTPDTDTLKLAQDQFLPLCGSWNFEDWDEYDYDRIKNLNFREIEMARREAGREATSKECLKCPNFLKHVS